MMELDRHDKARALFTKLAAEFIREEASSDPLITVTNVSVSPNYHTVTVFFTTIPEEKQEDALFFLKRKASEMREYFKKHARLKFVPHIECEVDYGERNRQRIDEVAQRIDEKKNGTS